MTRVYADRTMMTSPNRDYGTSPFGKFGDRNVQLGGGGRPRTETLSKFDRFCLGTRNLFTRLGDFLHVTSGAKRVARSYNREHAVFSRKVDTVLGKLNVLHDQDAHITAKSLLKTLTRLRAEAGKMSVQDDQFDHGALLETRMDINLGKMSRQELEHLATSLARTDMDKVLTAFGLDGQDALDEWNRIVEFTGETAPLGLDDVRAGLDHAMQDLRTIMGKVAEKTLKTEIGELKRAMTHEGIDEMVEKGSGMEDLIGPALDHLAKAERLMAKAGVRDEEIRTIREGQWGSAITELSDTELVSMMKILGENPPEEEAPGPEWLRTGYEKMCRYRDEVCPMDRRHSDWLEFTVERVNSQAMERREQLSREITDRVSSGLRSGLDSIREGTSGRNTFNTFYKRVLSPLIQDVGAMVDRGKRLGGFPTDLDSGLLSFGLIKEGLSRLDEESVKAFLRNVPEAELAKLKDAVTQTDVSSVDEGIMREIGERQEENKHRLNMHVDHFSETRPNPAKRPRDFITQLMRTLEAMKEFIHHAERFHLDTTGVPELKTRFSENIVKILQSDPPDLRTLDDESIASLRDALSAFGVEIMDEALSREIETRRGTAMESHGMALDEVRTALAEGNPMALLDNVEKLNDAFDGVVRTENRFGHEVSGGDDLGEVGSLLIERDLANLGTRELKSFHDNLASPETTRFRDALEACYSRLDDRVKYGVTGRKMVRLIAQLITIGSELERMLQERGVVVSEPKRDVWGAINRITPREREAIRLTFGVKIDPDGNVGGLVREGKFSKDVKHSTLDSLRGEPYGASLTEKAVVTIDDLQVALPVCEEFHDHRHQNLTLIHQDGRSEELFLKEVKGEDRLPEYNRFFSFCDGNEDLMFFLSQYCVMQSLLGPSGSLQDMDHSPFPREEGKLGVPAKQNADTKYTLSKTESNDYVLRIEHSFHVNAMVDPDTAEFLKQFKGNRSIFSMTAEIVLPRSMDRSQVRFNDSPDSLRYSCALVER